MRGLRIVLTISTVWAFLTLARPTRGRHRRKGTLISGACWTLWMRVLRTSWNLSSARLKEDFGTGIVFLKTVRGERGEGGGGKFLRFTDRTGFDRISLLEYHLRSLSQGKAYSSKSTIQGGKQKHSSNSEFQRQVWRIIKPLLYRIPIPDIPETLARCLFCSDSGVLQRTGLFQRRLKTGDSGIFLDREWLPARQF